MSARRGTYSIVAHDRATGETGVAVQSHWFSVGSIVSWARPGVGAVATQSIAEPAYGPRLLDRIAADEAPAAALEAELAQDDLARVRQVAAVDAAGRTAVHTGPGCIAHAGHRRGEGFCVQANMMASPDVWPAMAAAFEDGDGPLARRLLAALDAGEAAGGDLRGRQSAAVVVVPRDGEPWRRTVELRVEDAESPLGELRRLLDLHDAYALADRADALAGEGRHEAASALYIEAAAAAPANAELGFWAGLGLAAGGQVNAGVGRVRGVIAVDEAWRHLLARLDGEIAPGADIVREALGVAREGRPVTGAPYAPAAWDEAIDERGEPRPTYRALLEALSAADLDALDATVDRRLAERGVEFTSSSGEEIFHVDPVPRIVDREEWELLGGGLRQRAAALNHFVRDAYGERRIVAAGRVPGYVLETADHFEPRLVGLEPGADPAAIVGFDLVRGADGRLRVLEDNCRTPSGFSYAIAAREVLARTLDVPTPSCADPARAVALIRAGIEAAAGDGLAVLVTDGPSNSAWFEHRELGRTLGIPVLAPDALHRDGARLLCELDGERREIALVYRRTGEDRLFDRGEPTALGDLMLEPILAGALTVWNAFGAGVADDKLVHAYVEEMIRFYLGEEPLLRSVRTFDMSDDAARAQVLERLEEMVIKPRASLGGEGVVICTHASPEDRARIAREVQARPSDFVAQETIALSTHPTVAGGRLEPRHVDLRAFTVAGEPAPLAMTRYARGRGALVVNSSEGGGIKDTWILS